MNDLAKNQIDDDPEILAVEDEPIVEDIVVQYEEDPNLEDIILLDLTDIEKTRVKMSVSDITEEQEQRNCFICNKSMYGGVYLCPICGTFYCRKCIKSVIDRGGQCFNCRQTV